MLKAIRRAVLAALCAVAPAAAFGQASPTGTFTPGHALIATTPSGSPYADGGGAAGSSLFGKGYLTELGITASGTPFCINDALTSGPYHQFCLGSLALGGGLISYNAYKGASALGLQINVNGVNYPFPGAGNGNVTGPTSPAATGGNVAEWNGGTALKDSALPVTNLGVFYAQYGVSATNTAAQNTTAQTAAATAAYNQGVPLNICVGGASSVTIPTNGAPLYGGMIVLPCPGTVFQMQQDGAAFYTLPTPSSSGPGLSATPPLTIGPGLAVDQNNHHGTPLLIEGDWNYKVEALSTLNVGTGSWTHNDGANPTGSYLDAAMTVKTISNGSSISVGTYYGEIDRPNFMQPGFQPGGPGTITGGIGLLLTTTAGQTSPRPNITRVYGGRANGFTRGVYIQAGGDFRLYSTDLSGNTYGGVAGDPAGYNIPINRAVFDHPYLESGTSDPEYIGIWFTSVANNGLLNGVGSASAMATCVDDGTPATTSSVLVADNQCGTNKPAGAPLTPDLFTTATTDTYTPESPLANPFRVTLIGAGGAGGGCLASGSGTNCVSGGGAAGTVIVVQCQDPLQMNFLGAPYTVGAGGVAGTGAGGDGAATTLTGSITPFSAGTWTLPDWAALTAYKKRNNNFARSYVLPTVGNAGAFEFAAIASGTSGASHPTWPQTPGQTVVDGTVTWENIGPSVWSSGMTAFVDPVLRIGTLLGPSSGVNAGQYFYQAIQPGVVGSVQPTWPQKILSEVPDGAAIWFNVANSISLTAGGGKGGDTSGVVATSIELSPNGANNTSISGCTRENLSVGVPAGNATFNVTNGYGHSGSGGSNSYGRGGLSLSVANASTQQVGQNGNGPGGGGGGAISAINASGANKNGGAGADGGILIESWAGASP